MRRKKLSNVVSFPEHRIIREVPNEVIKAQIKRGTLRQVDMIFNELRENIEDFVFRTGIDVDNDRFNKDFQFAMDALRSCIYRNHDIDHKLQTFVDKHVVIRAEKTSIRIPTPK